MNSPQPCPNRRLAAVTLMELLCVMAIIAILAAMYLPTISHAFVHVKHALGIN